MKKNIFIQLKKFNWAIWMLPGLVYQLFFLRTDIFIVPTQSGGGFSDAGIDAEPIRNFLLHGVNTISETGTIFKGPLNSLLWFFITPICSTSYVTAKFIFLLLVTIVFFFIIKNQKQKPIWLLFYFLCCLHPLLGDYLHLPLGEWLSIVCIFCAITFLKSVVEEKIILSKSLFYSFMFLLFAVLFKVQYAYIIPVLPVGLVLLLPSFLYEKGVKNLARKIAVVVSIIIGFVFLMWLVWWLPNQERFISYYHNQDFFRLDRSWKDMCDTRHFWSRVLFYEGEWSVYRLPYKITLGIAAIILLLPKKINLKSEIAFVLAWNIFEWHKFNFSYLPERYLLGLFSAGILLMLFVSFSLLQTFKLYAVPVIAILFFLPLHWELSEAIHRLKTRTYSFDKSQQQLKKFIGKKDIVIGAYAPALCWNTGCETHYINDTLSNGVNILKRFTPDFILCDSIEEDIGKAFSAQRIDITQIATPVYTVHFTFLSNILYKVDKEKWKDAADKVR